MSALGDQIGLAVERRRDAEALSANEARHRAMLDAALDCVITMDHEGRVVDFNPAAERTFGYRASYAVGRDMAELMVPPELRERHRQGLARYIATEDPGPAGSPVEITGQRIDGTTFPVELTITRIDVPVRPPSPATCATSPTGRRRRRSCAPRAHASSRPRTTRGAGSNATSTTAPNSGSSSWPSTCGWRARGWTTTPLPSPELLDAALGDLEAATRELRELARGIHPAALTEGGLRPALEALTARS